MLLACLPFGPWVTSKLTFWPSFSVLKPCMLIAEKCANRSSPPPSGVMKPKPFASLNHFTVPVAIVGNSLSTRIKRDVARPMFRSQGKYGGRTTAWRSYRACLYCLEQNTGGTIRQISQKSDNFPAGGG